jgi:FlaA1/EpsC-like NDP-sugar epimerase
MSAAADTTATKPSRLRCLVVGAGEAGRAIVRDLRRVGSFGLWPVGFLDDDPAKQGRVVAGLPVVAGSDQLTAVAERLDVDVVVVAIPGLPASQVRRLGLAAAAVGASVRYLPSFLAALERDARLSDLRRLKVDELLGRHELRVVRPACKQVVAGKRVLVTGAGGSIGSELCRQIKAFGPAGLWLLDHDESNLHRLQLQLTGQALLDVDELVIADIRDHDRIRQVFGQVRPEVVFHAAAHKHLPLLERHPCEGVKSNVAGTLHLVRAALEVHAERFLLISTDKAADPRSVLGATKRVAELVVAAHAGGPTRMASVRFGNVLGSRGSLLSVVAEQLEAGEPVTVTHPEVTRFFMTVEEAVGLVLEAAGMAAGGEVFVLDMGRPVRIVELVEKYAAAVGVDRSGLVFRFTGLRPGEKLNEALFSAGEQRVATAHPKVWATRARPAGVGFGRLLGGLLAAAEANQPTAVRGGLARLLPEYRPAESSGVGLQAATALTAPYPDGF